MKFHDKDLSFSSLIEIIESNKNLKLPENVLNNYNCSSKLDHDKKTYLLLEKYDLTEMEASKILEIRPKSLLCLQLMIEDMEERYEIDTLLEILEVLKPNNLDS